MSNGPLTKITAATAAEICANLDLEKEAKQLLREEMNPQEFVTALIENKRCLDAVGFLAHALPAREGIWWGCLCMQHALGDDLPAPDRAAATAAVRWVIEPTEANCAAAKSPADAAPPPSLAGILAMAAFQTGANIAPASMPPKAPGPFASAKAVALSITLACAKTEPVKMGKRQRSYVELGLQVAEGLFI